ncbi:CDP-alcohol phosphatidyltransferase family protein [Methylovirgula sp. HY1]|uniref:CDP-alcohol phosphatidyltransferase family protein n=1 Tax=Methylovirgula sp. HY1 TaxID=2822761 RepID=UPI001C5AFF36|nr:CDP-alcohol phosphatidyltransferase family protein [Methylovirgula sp. HY1]
MSVFVYSSLPNLITLGRLVLVPIIVAMISAQRWEAACFIFILAGVSDAVDGWIAKTFDLRTELGAYLDPVADKALLVSIYVALAVEAVVPTPLAIIVVARDVMIIGAVMISWLMHRPVEIRPLWISKFNTAAQIGFAALVLGVKAFRLDLGAGFSMAIYGVAALTLASLAAYLTAWARHMSL